MKTKLNLEESRILSDDELGKMKGGRLDACGGGCEPGCKHACKPGEKYAKEEVERGLG
ncbi:MAG: hypothetical protein GQ574_19935 [Crocinitomix sp.]|nr:hypothetical protein [Crocinitomix sp.]